METRTKTTSLRSGARLIFPKIKNRYNNVPTEKNGQSFASKAEAALFEYLCLLEKAGEITDIRSQQHVYLTDARILYIADFSAIKVSTGDRIWMEQKGFETAVWRIKRRLWQWYGPGPLQIFKGDYRKISLYEEIIPCQKSSEVLNTSSMKKRLPK